MTAKSKLREFQNEQTSLFIYIIGCSVAYALFFYLFYNYIFNIAYDIRTHTDFAIEASEGNFSSTYPLMYQCIGFMHRYFDWKIAICTVIAFANTVSILFISTISYQITNKLKLSLFLGPVLILIGSIFNIFTKRFIIGTWTPNLLHNPTYIFLKPFALLVIVLLISILKQDDIYSYKNKKELILWGAMSVVLAASALAKPSFAQIFLPAALIFYIAYNLINKPKLKQFLTFSLKGIIAFLPTAGVLIWQYFTMIVNHQGYAEDSGLIFGGGYEVWKSATGGESVAFSILCMAAFPILVTLFNFKKYMRDNTIVFSWLIFASGTAQFLFFSETGINKYSFNFCWGYSMGALILFVCTTAKFFKIMNDKKESGKKARWLDIIKNAVCFLVFGMHLASGVYYHIHTLIGTTYKI